MKPYNIIDNIETRIQNHHPGFIIVLITCMIIASHSFEQLNLVNFSNPLTHLYNQPAA